MVERVRSVPREAWRDALRLALQSAAAGTVATVFAVLADMEEAYLLVLSAVFIVQPSVDGTLRTAQGRLTGTLVGSMVGLGVTLSLPGQFGSAVAMGLSLFAVLLVTWFRPAWDYGIYAAIALSLRAEEAVVETAVDRATAILAGAAIGIAVSQLLWREPARRRVVRHISRALYALADRAATTLDTATGDRSDYDHAAEARYFDAYGDAFATVEASGEADPRGNRRITAMRRLADSMVILDRAVGEVAAPAGLIEGFADPVRAARKAIFEVLSCLARGEEPDEAQFERLDRAVGDAAEIAREPKGDANERQAVGALVFGLTEVRANLRELSEAVVARLDDARSHRIFSRRG